MAKKRNENKDIRNFSIALTVLFGFFAALNAAYGDKPIWPYLAGIGLAALILGLFIRPVMRPIFRGWMWLAQKLNWAVTRILLTTFWLLVFVPFGLVMRLIGKDFLDRRWNPDKASYWRPRPNVPYDRHRSERLG